MSSVVVGLRCCDGQLQGGTQKQQARGRLVLVSFEVRRSRCDLTSLLGGDKSCIHDQIDLYLGRAFGLDESSRERQDSDGRTEDDGNLGETRSVAPSRFLCDSMLGLHVRNQWR